MARLVEPDAVTLEPDPTAGDVHSRSLARCGDHAVAIEGPQSAAFDRQREPDVLDDELDIQRVLFIPSQLGARDVAFQLHLVPPVAYETGAHAIGPRVEHQALDLTFHLVRGGMPSAVHRDGHLHLTAGPVGDFLQYEVEPAFGTFRGHELPGDDAAADHLVRGAVVLTHLDGGAVDRHQRRRLLIRALRHLGIERHEVERAAARGFLAQPKDDVVQLDLEEADLAAREQVGIDADPSGADAEDLGGRAVEARGVDGQVLEDEESRAFIGGGVDDDLAPEPSLQLRLDLPDDEPRPRDDPHRQTGDDEEDQHRADQEPHQADQAASLGAG
jgi:hypothetical protein